MTGTGRRAFLLWAALALVACDDGQSYRERIRAGDSVVWKIEQFSARRGRLPETLDEVGVLPGVDWRYRRLSRDHYTLAFSARLGQHVTYDSRSREWN
jgi:hypothetical protein